MTTKTETGIFAAGCFWGVEAAFEKLPGVLEVSSGYTGGTKHNPTYKEVCTGTTGHAEAVQVVFDPSKTTFSALLEAFFAMHDPTQKNRQGPDVGTQYRSGVFYTSDAQKAAAEAAKAALDSSGKLKAKVATEIAKATTFFRAEEYHQKYFHKNPGACHMG